MISFINSILVSGSTANGNALYWKEGFCLSDDTKPIDDDSIANGSRLTEMDTGSVYYFDGASTTWVTPS